MVGVRYHLDLREIEGNVVEAFSKENKGERGLVRGSLGVVWCGAAKGLLSLTVLTWRGAACGEVVTTSHLFIYFFTVVFSVLGSSLTCMS